MVTQLGDLEEMATCTDKLPPRLSGSLGFDSLAGDLPILGTEKYF